MNQVTYTSCKSRTRGLRVWIEGQKLVLAGFEPNSAYSLRYTGQLQMLGGAA